MSVSLIPPFTLESATAKVQLAENAWNSRNAVVVSRAYSVTSHWRNRHEFFSGRDAIVEFLEKKWQREHEYRLRKELWTYHGHRIAVRFEYEWHDDQLQWYRSYGNEMWEFDSDGLMSSRFASINDEAIEWRDRRILHVR